MSDNLIEDFSSDKKYFTIIPNFIFDFPMDVYCFRVYCHIKRVAGDTGICWQSTRTIARKCQISPSTVTRSIRKLAKAGFINLQVVPGKHGEFPHNEITIRDIWANNHFFFELGDKDKKDLILNLKGMMRNA